MPCPPSECSGAVTASSVATGVSTSSSSPSPPCPSSPPLGPSMELPTHITKPKYTAVHVIQINENRAFQAAVDVANKCHEYPLSIALITEPYVNHKKVTNIPLKYKCISANEPRSAILFHSSLSVTKIQHLTTKDSAVGLCKINDRNILFVSFYSDIHLPVKQDILRDIITYADLQGFELCMGADTNAHSTLFGPDNNKRGEDLEELIIDHHLKVANTGNIPTFETFRDGRYLSSYIDYTFTKRLQGDVAGWRVEQAFNGSDHNTISYDLILDLYVEPRIRWSKIDWSSFTEYLRGCHIPIPSHVTKKKVDKLVQKIYAVILKAIELASPPPPDTVQDTKPLHWFKPHHKTLKRAVRKAYDKALKSKAILDIKHYKKLQNDLKNKCHKSRDRGWKYYKADAKTIQEAAFIAKVAQRLERSPLHTLNTEQGHTKPGGETIQALIDQHFPTATEPIHIPYDSDGSGESQYISSLFQDWINSPLIIAAMDKFLPKKSPGPDDLSPVLFTHLPSNIIDTLTFIYKACIFMRYTPYLWRVAKVIFLPKPGKDDYCQAKSFRPIALSNYLLKTLERLVVWKMDLNLIEYPLHHKQHGFLSHKGTESALSYTINYIEKNIMDKKFCVGVFLDISSAFDSILPNHVRDCLLQHGGQPELVGWYYHYMTNRNISVQLHGETRSVTLNRGFPQGGVASAKFWLIAFNEAIRIINSYNIEGNGFADDCSAILGGSSLEQVTATLNKMLRELVNWGRSCGLTFNPDKTVAVLFSRRKVTPSSYIYLDGKRVPYSPSVKYLGVTLDKKLFWNTHINNKIKAAKKFLVNVNSIVSDGWGPSPRLMRWAYIGIVRPMLSYGSMVWQHALKDKKGLNGKLQRLNRLALNSFTHIPRSTPTKALEVFVDLLPMPLFLQMTALATYHRLHDQLEFGWNGLDRTRKRNNISHLKNLMDLTNRLDLPPGCSDRCYARILDKSYHINTDSFDGKAFHRRPSQYNIYTDGSKQGNAVGAGIVVLYKNLVIYEEAVRLPDSSTVFQAELYAIGMAASFITNTPDIQFVKILTDSQSSLNALNKYIFRSRTVLNTHNTLQDAADSVQSLNLVWIKAHIGYWGNERADFVAKEATTLPDVTAVNVTLPMSYIKSAIRTTTYEQWGTLWRTYPAARQAKFFYGNPDPTTAHNVIRLTRCSLGTVIRVLSGHNALAYFKNKVDPENFDPFCRFCDMNRYETFIHLIDECPRFVLHRREIFMDIPIDNTIQWTPTQILRFASHQEIRMALQGFMDGIHYDDANNIQSTPAREEDTQSLDTSNTQHSTTHSTQ